MFVVSFIEISTEQRYCVVQNSNGQKTDIGYRGTAKQWMDERMNGRKTW